MHASRARAIVNFLAPNPRMRVGGCARRKKGLAMMFLKGFGVKNMRIRFHAPLRMLLAFGLLAAASGAALAAPPPATWSASITPARVRAGETVTVMVTARITPPWYVYSVVPVPPPGPLETSLTFDAKPLQPVGGVTESVPKRERDPNFDKEVAYHGGTATFRQRLQVPRTVRPGTRIPINPCPSETTATRATTA